MSGKNQYNNKIKKKYLYGIFMPIMILLCINITEKFYLNMIYKNLHKKNKKQKKKDRIKNNMMEKIYI